MDIRITVGELKEIIYKLSDDTPIYIERIEDSYFDGTKGWSTIEFPFYPDMTTDGIRAFGAYVNDNRLLIHAHY